MQRLDTAGIERVRRFLEETSVPCDLSTFTSVLLPATQHLIPSVVACYAQFDPVQGRVVAQAIYPEIAPGKDSLEQASILSRHPVFEAWSRMGDTAALRRSDLLSRRQWHRHEVFQHVYKDWGCEDSMPVGLPAPRGLLACLCSERDTEFTEAERDILDLVRPHIAQMYRSAEMVTLLAKVTQSGRVCTMMLDPAGRPLLATQSGWDLIAKYFPGHSALSALFPRPVGEWLQAEMLRWSGAEALPRPVSDYVVRGEDGSGLSFRLLFGERTGEQALLVLEERPAPAPASVPDHLGLSPREVEILTLVRMGKTSGEIAETLFLSRRTVEKHLENVYCKLGVENRTAAVAVAFAGLDGG
jgi:DNA-binding CsgD family transcriptional regulator